MPAALSNYVIIHNKICLKQKKNGRIRYEVCKNRLLETFYVYMSSRRNYGRFGTSPFRDLTVSGTDNTFRDFKLIILE